MRANPERNGAASPSPSHPAHPPRPRDGCPEHALQNHEGKPFALKAHWEQLRKEGLISSPKPLANARTATFTPAGKAKKDGGRTVYPSFQ